MVMMVLSPLRMTLCALPFFIHHVYAVSAVLGIDLGTEYIKASLVKPGIPLDIVLTKDSRRKEISAVTFKPPQNGPKEGEFPERLYGSDAMALSARFPGDVFPNLKAILGLSVDSPAVRDYVAWHPALQLQSHKVTNTAAFKSKDAFTPEEQAWLVEELLAMQLQSIRKNAENMAGPSTSVRSVVITIPPFYTLEEKRALGTALELAGLKTLSLISDGLAVGVNYASSRTFPNINDAGKPELHMVFDMGAGSTKSTVLKMQSRTVKDIAKANKTIQEVLVLGSGWDRSLGGDALNAIIVDDMIERFVESPGAKKVGATVKDVKAHGRAIAKLFKEAERLRQVLSANQNSQASFEGLYEEVDFKYKITRAEFETMAETHASRVGAVVQGALDMAGVKVQDLDSVILHGGATRTPFVHKELETIFGAGDKIRSNVNADESAVFGAGLRAAELSPSFRVKEIRIGEGAVYPAGVRWTDDKGKARHQRLWTPTSHLGATAKEVTFNNNKDDFSAEFYQESPSLASDGTTRVEEKVTKTFSTKNLTETVASMKEKYSCEPSDVEFKFSVRLSSESGEAEVIRAYVECVAEIVEKESLIDGVKNMFGFGKKDEQKPLTDGEPKPAADGESPEAAGNDPVASAEPGDSTPAPVAEATASTVRDESAVSKPTPSAVVPPALKSEDPATKGGKKTNKTISVPVKFEVVRADAAQLDKLDIGKSKDRLKAFERSDKLRRQREEALNQLEGFTYKVRELLENEAFVAASTEKDRKLLEQKSLETGDWLYGEGVDASKDELKKRLKGLQDIVTPIQKRIEESAERPRLLEELKKALERTDEFVKDTKQKIAEAEAWTSSQSTATSSASSSASSAALKVPADDFADLEDDSSASQTPTTEEAVKDRGPVPPLYTLEDLKETEDVSAKIAAWIQEKEPAQEKLGATDDPVLTVKELKDWRQRLDKASQNLALKSVDDLKKTKASSSKTKKPKANKAKEAPGSEQTIQLGKDGKMPSEEELEQLIKRLTEENAARKAAEKGEETGEETGREEKAKDSHEHERDEL